MTEAEWLACTDPIQMLEFLRGRAGDRKLRLFAIACCRRIDQLISDQRSREALEFAERHVERGVLRRKGRAGIERAARAAHIEAYNRMFSFPAGEERAKCLILSNALDAAAQTLSTRLSFAASYASSFSVFAVAWEAQVASGIDPYPDLRDSFKRPEKSQQAHLLRDLFGNPFRPVALGPAWLTWQDGTLPKLAQAIYEDRQLPTGHLDTSRLGVLADALEDAGCDDANILDHCRHGGPHVRGCWIVDLFLGKE
jgi:hypothetical protein